MSAWIIVGLVAIDAVIALVFAFAVSRRAGDVWQWPPSWLRLVSAWIGNKGIWLAALALLWGTGAVGFDDDAGPWARALYVGTLAGFTVPHFGALVYWVTGRAVRVDSEGDADFAERMGWDGTERRTGPPGRRASDAQAYEQMRGKP